MPIGARITRSTAQRIVAALSFEKMLIVASPNARAQQLANSKNVAQLQCRR
jgi:hypothetical protein